MTAETHIVSFLLRCDPLRTAGLDDRLRALGLEIALQEAGKIVLLMETGHDTAIAETLTTLQLMDGVASAALVYHHTLSDAAEGTA